MTHRIRVRLGCARAARPTSLVGAQSANMLGAQASRARARAHVATKHRARPRARASTRVAASATSSARANAISKVVVIGAGWGGIGAAKSLCEAGADVTLVDVQDDPTGATPTLTKSGKPFEAGTRGACRMTTKRTTTRVARVRERARRLTMKRNFVRCRVLERLS